VLLTLAGLAYIVAMWVGVPRVTDFEDLREAEAARVAAESAPSVADRAAQAILAYDYRRLDADQDAAVKFMTDDFADKYSTSFTRAVKPLARANRAQVVAEVQGTSVIRASAERVTVLLFVDQTTRSTARDRPQLALNRVQFDMVLRDGDWLVDDISSY
jgi:Mce-associated membrane protein